MLQSLTAGWRSAWGSKLRRREMLFAYAGLIPFAVAFLGFLFGPLLYSFYLTFTSYRITRPPSWIGLDNYTSMFKDPLFWLSLRVTSIYAFVAVPLGLVVGYGLALLLNQKVRGLSVWRTLFYLPSVVPAVASAYLFAWIFNDQIGLVNTLLKMMGIHGPNWLGNPDIALRTFIIMSLWGAGGGMILYLAALQQVPTELYDASKIDGANSWQRLLNITIPMTSPVILFNLIIGIIGSFQVFTTIFIVTAGGPANATLTYVLYLYQNGWQFFRMGYAAALAWVLFVIIFLLTLLTLRLTGRLVYYEGG